MGELSDRQVQAWMRARKPIAGKSDGGGLTFTLSASGTASWVFRFRLHGKPKELTLGNYPDIPLKTARKLATKARAEVDQAIDVAQAKRQKTVEAKKAGTYDRHSYFEERKHALGVWADLLQTLERGEKYKVVSINSKAAA
jgi:hypothetical protein